MVFIGWGGVREGEDYLYCVAQLSMPTGIFNGSDKKDASWAVMVSFVVAIQESFHPKKKKERGKRIDS